MTSTDTLWTIVGKSRHGGKYAVASGFTVREVLPIVNTLNAGRDDPFFHHFSATRVNDAPTIRSILPGEWFGSTAEFVGWLVTVGLVVSCKGGVYQIGEDRVRGRQAVAEKFGTQGEDGSWTVSRFLYAIPE